MPHHHHHHHILAPPATHHRLRRDAQAPTLARGMAAPELKAWRLDFERLMPDRSSQKDPPGYDAAIATNPVRGTGHAGGGGGEQQGKGGNLPCQQGCGGAP